MLLTRRNARRHAAGVGVGPDFHGAISAALPPGDGRPGPAPCGVRQWDGVCQVWLRGGELPGGAARRACASARALTRRPRANAQHIFPSIVGRPTIRSTASVGGIQVKVCARRPRSRVSPPARGSPAKGEDGGAGRGVGVRGTWRHRCVQGERERPAALSLAPMRRLLGARGPHEACGWCA